MLFYRCKVGRACAPPYRRLRYDNIRRLVVDRCRLANTLLGKQDVNHNASLAKRLDIGGMLCHHVIKRERFTIRELGSNLLGERLVQQSRLARSLGLCRVLLEHVELVGNLAGKVLGSVLLGVIVVPKRLGDDLGRDITRDVHDSREHLVIGELILGASGSHELTPSRPWTRANRLSVLFSLSPLDNYYFTSCINFWQYLILYLCSKYGNSRSDGRLFRFSNLAIVDC